VTDALESLRIHAIGRVTACAERLNRVAHGHVLLYNQGKLRVLIALTDRRAEGLRIPDGIDPRLRSSGTIPSAKRAPWRFARPTSRRRRPTGSWRARAAGRYRGGVQLVSAVCSRSVWVSSWLRADSSSSQYADTIAIETRDRIVILRDIVDDLIGNDDLLVVASDAAGVAEAMDAPRVRRMEARA
jgi:hypothetical protein